MKHSPSYLSALIPCLFSLRRKNQFPHMEVKIAIDALKCSNFSYFLMAHLPSSPSSPPLNTSLDLHILHQLDEFTKGTSGRAGEQTTPLDLICILSSKGPDCLLLEKYHQEREQRALCQHPSDSLHEAETA